MKMMHRGLAVATSGWLALAAGAIVGGCGPTYPNCNNDEQCHEGEFCVNGQCQDCRDDSQCPVGQRCTSGACEPTPGWCASDADCGPDEECVENFCQPRPVETTTEVPEAGPCQLQPVYFSFDDSTLDDSARTSLESNVQCMNDRTIQSVMITGMTDPRGTEEYNMALGDRRARSTRDHLQRLGIERRRMQTRSVGEEQATGADESGWARDRRADLTER
ncbi:MAG: OmpA family protein [Myxococcota bacterium]|nr:OmpA family protein [Myxococcota bacterium]